MSEDQENSVLKSQSIDSVDSLKEDANGVSVMSKSKARSLRRKRAKQRKQAIDIQEEKKAEPQGEENHIVPLPQEGQTSQKKKARKKKKNKLGEQRKNDAFNDNSSETPKDIAHVQTSMENIETKSIKTTSSEAGGKDLQNGKVGVKSLNTNSMKTPILAAEAKDISNLKKIKNRDSAETLSSVEAPKDTIAKSEVEKAKSENTDKIQLTSSVKKSSPVKKETDFMELDDSVATPIETTRVEANELNIVPTSVYEDGDENKEQTKEDCACACIVS